MSRRALIQIVSCLLALVVLAGGTLSVVEISLTRHVTRTRTFTAAVQRIQARVDTGDIVIHGAPPGTPVTVRSRTTSAFHTGSHTEVLRNGVLNLSGTCGHRALLLIPTCSVDFDVVVPTGTAVQTTSSSGDITITGIDGHVVAVSDDGDVEVNQVGGDVSLRTDNGNLLAKELTSSSVSARTDNGDVDLRFSAAPESVTATTSNGDVDLALPDVADGYRVEADTDNGDREVSVPVQSSSTRRIQVDSSNGDVHVTGT